MLRASFGKRPLIIEEAPFLRGGKGSDREDLEKVRAF